MTEQMAGGYDDLLRLWQDTALELPERGNLSARLARMTFASFRFWMFFEDAVEYAGVLFVVAVAAVPWMVEGDWMPTVVATTGGVFVMCYFRAQRRRWTRLDPAADARTYHAALLDRIDGRIRLYGTAPYWCVRVLPLYLPFVWMFVAGWRRDGGPDTVGAQVVTALGMLLTTAAFAGLCWFIQRRGLRDWESYRAAVEAVYADRQ